MRCARTALVTEAFAQVKKYDHFQPGLAWPPLQGPNTHIHTFYNLPFLLQYNAS